MADLFKWIKKSNNRKPAEVPSAPKPHRIETVGLILVDDEADVLLISIGTGEKGLKKHLPQAVYFDGPDIDLVSIPGYMETGNTYTSGDVRKAVVISSGIEYNGEKLTGREIGILGRKFREKYAEYLPAGFEVEEHVGYILGAVTC